MKPTRPPLARVALVTLPLPLRSALVMAAVLLAASFTGCSKHSPPPAARPKVAALGDRISRTSNKVMNTTTKRVCFLAVLIPNIHSDPLPELVQALTQLCQEVGIFVTVVSAAPPSASPDLASRTNSGQPNDPRIAALMGEAAWPVVAAAVRNEVARNEGHDSPLYQGFITPMLHTNGFWAVVVSVVYPAYRKADHINLLVFDTGQILTYARVAAPDPEPLPVLEALPPPEMLGPNWSRHLCLLFDPASNPAEIVEASAQVTDAFRTEKRNAVANPTNEISGWSHAHYIVQGTNGSHRYEVQVDRYRNPQRAARTFGQLLGSEPKDCQKTEVQGIGEAAVIYRDASGMTLWFRSGPFRVWISPLTGNWRWEDDAALQQLAKAFDTRLSAMRRDKTAGADPKAER